MLIIFAQYIMEYERYFIMLENIIFTGAIYFFHLYFTYVAYNLFSQK